MTEPRETTTGQDIVMCEVIGGLRRWPTVVEEHVYTERIVFDPSHLVADILTDALPTLSECRRERLPVPIVERTERLAWPWEFPDA